MREGLKAQSRELFRWCFWLLLWELAARLLHNRLLLVGPLETIGVLFRMALGAVTGRRSGIPPCVCWEGF